MKSIFFCIFLTVFPFFLYPQGTLPVLPDPEEQILFLKQDTLPVEVELLPRRINTRFSEYNGILYPDSSFFFSSLRDESEGDYQNIFKSFWAMKIYQSWLTISGYSRPEPLPKSINHPKYFNANFTFNAGRDHLYFTRCQPVIDTELKCELWESKKTRGKWAKPVKLNYRINLPGTSNTQPFLVEYEDFTVLYFSSDRPKGFGGMDIWFTILKDGKYEDPINLGNKINTPGDEITPFYDPARKVLYFSSDYHPGIGGFDIFYSQGAMSDWAVPSNMGVPFNSERNDYYFTQNSFNRSGYFCSNRPTARSRPGDTCCYDIFTYRWLNDPEPPEYVPEDTVPDTLTTIERIRLSLPLVLYFHNDRPDPRSLDSTTLVDYRAALSDYIALKDLYRQEYARGLTGAKKEEAQLAIDLFFRDSVGKGFQKLELFTRYLVQELEAGKNISITVSGYASALHGKEYNRRLTLRRIASFKNYLEEYDNGILVPYMYAERQNKLTIITDPKGSMEAIRKNISDNPQDKRNSIYSIEASLERRIQITEIEEW